MNAKKGTKNMKKRIISLLAALILSITMIPAVDQTKAYAQSVTSNVQTQVAAQSFSVWAFNDLVIGDSYRIYPLTWYQKDMKAPITQGQLRILMAGLRGKMLNTKLIAKSYEQTYDISKNITVETVLTTLYKVVGGYDLTSAVDLKSQSAIAFMKENGIFTGTNGELGLKDVCSLEQACVFTTRLVTCIYDKLDAASKGFLWVVKSGENTVYMLGSIHLASKDIYPFSEKMLDAYRSSNALAVEVNLFNQEGIAKYSELGVYSDGTTLKDHVTEETYKKTIAFAATLGYSEQIISMCKPWYLYTQFGSLANTNSGNAQEAQEAAALGIDINFTTNAMVYGKPILEVEGIEYQAKVLDSFSAELEEYLLSNSIDQINKVIAGTDDTGADSIDYMLDLWRKGDVAAFKEYTTSQDEYADVYEGAESTEELNLIKEFKEKLFTKRDVGMTDYIDTLLKGEGSTTYFVVVGSGHYISDYSVLDMLKLKGYEISQIK